MGSNVYIRSGLYEQIIKLGHDPKEFVNNAVQSAIERERYLIISSKVSSKTTQLNGNRKESL